MLNGAKDLNLFDGKHLQPPTFPTEYTQYNVTDLHIHLLNMNELNCRALLAAAASVHIADHFVAGT